MASSSGYGVAPQTDAQFQKNLENAAKTGDRVKAAQAQADKSGIPISYTGPDGSSGIVYPSGYFGTSKASSDASVAKDSSASKTDTGTGSAFGVNDYLTMAGGAQDLAKDMAEFQLGINEKQSAQDYYFREKEDVREFGQAKEFKGIDFTNTQALQGQQIAGQQTLTETQQAAETGRLQAQLSNQKEMQQADFTNQTQQRAQSAALAQLGFRR
jgi:hypothetical protein